ncbi:MAG TPA: hypothetical protein DDZ40_05535 [Deltaproteobacteria bacterium]|nr:hypothetical protein [Deltaproteobacteria bacterium]
MGGIGKTLSVSVLLVATFSGCGREAAIKEPVKTGAVSDVRHGKELEEIRKSLRGDIKIKLRRDGKGAYSWEIAGKDPQEIIRADSTLSKRISDGKPE